ncbi:hypothetical protein OPQ81_003273 [Rhizoctonia solani]|nr:hypothetical protein OPQ81_003273 [Rhizoctonia solani]
MPSWLSLARDAAASTVTAPVVEDRVACDQTSQYTGEAPDGLPCLSAVSPPIPAPAVLESDGRITPTTEITYTANSSGTSTSKTDSAGSQNVVESGQMTSTEMFQCLVDHGCQDLTSSIDPNKYSSCRIAEGGFGDVWKGQSHNGMSVAVKVLRCALVTCTNDERKGLKRMMREIYTWSKLDHKNIHKLLGVTMFQGRLGMVSEWMTNGNLRDYLRRTPNVDRYELYIQIAQAVEYIHDKDMVHGDLKASNILMSPDGVVKLTDFDYSVVSAGSLLFTDTTRVGGGTYRWMAPELVIGTCHQRSEQTDVYALGMFRRFWRSLPVLHRITHSAAMMLKSYLKLRKGPCPSV